MITPERGNIWLQYSPWGFETKRLQRASLSEDCMVSTNSYLSKKDYLQLYLCKILVEISSKNHEKEKSPVDVNTGLSALQLISIHPAF